jgi:hypothetical protein
VPGKNEGNFPYQEELESTNLSLGSKMNFTMKTLLLVITLEVLGFILNSSSL